MIEFLTWNERHVHEYNLGQKIWMIFWFTIIGGMLLYGTFYLLGLFISWLNDKFFTVYEWELDDIDMEENQNGSKI